MRSHIHHMNEEVFKKVEEKRYLIVIVISKFSSATQKPSAPGHQLILRALRRMKGFF